MLNWFPTFDINVISQRMVCIPSNSFSFYCFSQTAILRTDTRIIEPQELERQAVEQYGDGNAADEKRIDSNGSKPSDEPDCLDGRRCSGHRQCSPAREDHEKQGKRFYYSRPISRNISMVTLLKKIWISWLL